MDRLGAIATSLDPPMLVVTAASDHENAGCLVGFHSQTSIDPDRYGVWLSKANHTWRVAHLSTHLAVHFLHADDLDLARHFGTLTGDEVDKFAGVAHRLGPAGVPVLEACPHVLVGRRREVIDSHGDHSCVILESESVSWPSVTGERFRPLRLSEVDHLSPGHEAEERQAPPR